MFTQPFLRRLLLALLTSIGFLFFVGIMLFNRYRETLGQQVLHIVQEQLLTKIEVQRVDLTLLRTLPHAAIILEGVEIEDLFGEKLLLADKIALKFHPLSAISSHINIRTLLVENGELMLKKDSCGNVNFDILRAEASPQDQDLSLSIRNAQLRHIAFSYNDAYQDIVWNSTLNDITLSGKFTNQQLSARSQGDILIRGLRWDTTNYIVHSLPVGWQTDLSFNLSDPQCQLHFLDLKIGSFPFTIQGQIAPYSRDTIYNLSLFTHQTELKHLTELLPIAWQLPITHLESTGQLGINAHILGTAGEEGQPRIDVDFTLEEGTIATTSTPNHTQVEALQLCMQFTNDSGCDLSDANLKISSLSGILGNQPFDMNLEVTNFIDPYFNFSFNGAFPIPILSSLLNANAIEHSEGRIAIEDMQLVGRYADIVHPTDSSHALAKGTLIFDNAAWRINGEDLVINQGVLSLNGSQLQIVNLTLTGAGSHCIFKGQFNDIFSLLATDNQAENPRRLRFDAQLYASSLDMDRMMKWFEMPLIEKTDANTHVVDAQQQAHAQQRARVSHFLQGTFLTQVRSFNYRKIELSDFSGQLSIANGRVDLFGYASGMQGTWQLNGRATLGRKPHLRAQLQAVDVDVQELFDQGENFGQSFINSNHISGQFSTKTLVEAQWDASGNLLLDKLKIVGGIGIYRGKLTNFEMLQSFADYTDVEALKQLVFADIETWFYVQHNTVYLPTTFIRSNIVNLQIAGQHTFDNEMEYYIKLNAAQAALRKLKRRKGDPKPLPDRRKGWFNLNYYVYGTPENAHYERNQHDTYLALKRGEHHRQAIQQTLSNALGINQVQLTQIQ